MILRTITVLISIPFRRYLRVLRLLGQAGSISNVNLNTEAPKKITSSFPLKMAFLDDAKQLILPYYLLNSILSISFLVLKTVSPMCNYLFPPTESQCELDMVMNSFLH